MVELFLAIISGAAAGIIFIFPGFSFLAWVFLLPLFFLLAKKRSFKRAFLFFVFGAVYYGLTIYWVAQVTFLGLVFLVIYLGLFYVLFYFLASFFFRRPLRQLSIPFAWVLIEFLKEIIWCGFGWANLGYSQFNNLYLIQIADIGGAKIIAFLIVLVNFLVWEIIVSIKNKKKASFILSKAALIALVFLLPITYSLFRLNQRPAGSKIKVSVIQPNFFSRYRLRKSEKKYALSRLQKLIEKTPLDALVVLPEAAWPYSICRGQLAPLNQFLKQQNRDIVLGAIRKDNSSYYNSAFFFKQSKGKQVYDKVILVPFGEYVPARRYLHFIQALNQIEDMSFGRELTQFSYRGKKFSVLICFEDIVPLFVARAGLRRDFLLNITDDSWFKGNPQARQHLSIMVLRAVENRIPIVRAANTGYSGWVSKTGRVEKLKKNSEGLFVESAATFDIRTAGKRSFYNKAREWLPGLAFIFLLTVAFLKNRAGKNE